MAPALDSARERLSIQSDTDFKELKLMAQTMDVPTATPMPDPMQRVWLAACIAAGAPSTSLGVRQGELQKLLATGEFYMCLIDDWQGSAERLVASKSAVGYLLLGLDPVLVGAEESSLASTTATVLELMLWAQHAHPIMQCAVRDLA